MVHLESGTLPKNENGMTETNRSSAAMLQELLIAELSTVIPVLMLEVPRTN